MTLIGQALGIEKPDPLASDRLEKCWQCPLGVQELGVIWCGTPLVGSNINYNNEPVNLCGCNMNRKTKVTSAQCPIKSW